MDLLIVWLFTTTEQKDQALRAGDALVSQMNLDGAVGVRMRAPFCPAKNELNGMKPLYH